MTDIGLLIVKMLASFFSVAMMLSPSLQIRRVLSEKRTGELAIMPLAMVFLCCHTWMVYGLITGDMFPLFVTYFIGFVAGAVYIGVFYHYTTEKAYARRVMLVTVALVVVISAYTILGKAGVLGQSSDSVDQVVGYLTVCTTVALYTSPFETIARVVKTKSAASIPVLMCACGSVSNTLWITYGLLQHDAFVWGLGVFCVVFALIQVVLYFVYYPKTLPQQQHHQQQHHHHQQMGGAQLFDDVNKHELSIAIESPVFTVMKSPLAPLHS